MHSGGIPGNQHSGSREEKREIMNIVHVVGTGTIGEPLIGLLADHKADFGIDEVTFHKRTPLITERSKVNDLVRRGAVLAVDEDKRSTFEELGHTPKWEAKEAIDRATVVIDCTPVGNDNKAEFYDQRGPSARLHGPGLGVRIREDVCARDQRQRAGPRGRSLPPHRVVQHPQHRGPDQDAGDGRRRDQPSHRWPLHLHPPLERHLPGLRILAFAHCGTAQGRSLRHPPCPRRPRALRDPGLRPQSLLVGSEAQQPVHALDPLLADPRRGDDVDEAKERLLANKRVAITYRKSANSVFSFGRDHGYFGRILTQTVVAIDTLTIRNGNELVGFCFTPQDGNPLLSTLAATLWFIDPDEVDDRLDIMRPYLFQEV